MKTSAFSIPGFADKPIALDLSFENENDPMVIFVHGFKGFKDWGTHPLTARFFAQNGFRFLKFNFSHNGISENSIDIFDDIDAFSENTFSKELFDLDEVLTFALSGEKFKAPEKLYLIGHSLGGGLSIIQTAEDKRVDKLVSWASLSTFRNLWTPEEEDRWMKEGVKYFQNSRTNQEMPIKVSLLEDLEHNSERLDILASARKIKQPWLIIHGEEDSSVPLAQAKELHRQQSGSRLHIISGADHVFGGRHPWTDKELPEKLREVCILTIEFFKGN